MGKIIVMGGSFNPPTIAHFKLIEAALEQLKEPEQSVRGIFVPSSHAYVSRKMGKLDDVCDKTVLAEQLRLEMLESFHLKDHRLHVDARELGTENVHGHTVETLQAIQKENPEDDIYFIFGGDKLEGLPRWRYFDTLVRQFKIIIFSRDGIDPRVFINSNEVLSQHRDAFVFLKQPDGLDGISSSAVRERIRRSERADELLTSDIYTMLLANRHKKENTILCFQGANYFLSNFYECEVFYGWPYGSTEAAFQAAKCESDDEKYEFIHLSPNAAKRKGRQVKLRSDWEQVKDGIMMEIVHEKFFQWEHLARKLMATGDAELIEGNTWNDRYWGVDLHAMQGQNKLGKILMKVRDELNCIPPEKFQYMVRTSPYSDAWGNDEIMDRVSASWKKRKSKSQ